MEILKRVIYGTCMVVMIAAWTTAAGTVLLYAHNDDKLAQIEYQGQADVLIYQGKMASFMIACDQLGIEPRACLQGWVARGD